MSAEESRIEESRNANPKIIKRKPFNRVRSSVGTLERDRIY